MMKFGNNYSFGICLKLAKGSDLPFDVANLEDLADLDMELDFVRTDFVVDFAVLDFALDDFLKKDLSDFCAGSVVLGMG